MRNETIDETINATIAKQYTDWMVKTGGHARDMTMRDHFAGLVLQGMCASKEETSIADGETYEDYWEGLAKWSYILADAMLKERNK